MECEFCYDEGLDVCACGAPVGPILTDTERIEAMGSVEWSDYD